MVGDPKPMTGWGQYPVVDGRSVASEDLSKTAASAVLCRGLGRAYGDAALPPTGEGRPVAITTRADRILAFDPSSGVLRAESGLSLRELAQTYLPRNWFSPVSPGTQFVTLGGMVASDIHGKNHHIDGTIGTFVRSLRMQAASGEILEVNRESHPALFKATLGGMGLTGHILEVELQLSKLPSPWIYEESARLPNLDTVLERLHEAGERFPYTVAWIDTSLRGRHAGRGLLTAGRWATAEEAPATPPIPQVGPPVPFRLPSGLVNRVTIQWMNLAWYYRHLRREKSGVVHPGPFFWPLDLVREWYRGYGRRGFTQYQCVLPRDRDVLKGFLERFQRLGGCSFVTVLKDCGPQGEGLLSFPRPGTTVALDIPIRSVPIAQKLVTELNAYVLDHEGRVYLAKDAFTTAEDFRRMYPTWEAFEAVRDRWDPERSLASAQSVRLFNDPRPAYDASSTRSLSTKSASSSTKSAASSSLSAS